MTRVATGPSTPGLMLQHSRSGALAKQLSRHGSGRSFTFLPPPPPCSPAPTDFRDQTLTSLIESPWVFIWSSGVWVSPPAGLEIAPQPDLRQTWGARLNFQRDGPRAEKQTVNKYRLGAEENASYAASENKNKKRILRIGSILFFPCQASLSLFT